jgi:hypothetical protein
MNPHAMMQWLRHFLIGNLLCSATVLIDVCDYGIVVKNIQKKFTFLIFLIARLNTLIVILPFYSNFPIGCLSATVPSGQSLWGYSGANKFLNLK